MNKSTIARLLGKVLYHFGRSKVDRKHRLKLSEEFTQSMMVMDRSELDKDELADAVLSVSDETGHDPQELAEAVYHLAATGYGDEIPTLLSDVATLAEGELCDLQTAARGLGTLLLQFKVEPEAASRIVTGLLYLAIRTQLTVPEAIQILETVGIKAIHFGKSFEEVVADIITVCEEIEVYPSEEYSTVVLRHIRDQYDQQLQALD